MTTGQILFLYEGRFFDAYTYNSKGTKRSASPQKFLPEPTVSKALPAKKASPTKRKKTADSDSDDDANMKMSGRIRPRKKMNIIDSSEDELPAKTVTESAQAHRAQKKPRASTSRKTAKKDEEFMVDSNEIEAESSGADNLSKGKKSRPATAKTKAKVEDQPTATSVKGKEKEKQEPRTKFECVSHFIALNIAYNSTCSWATAKAAKLAGPVAHGSKQVPDGAPNALVGLSFVFTGELSSFSREEAVDLAKRYGGYVLLASQHCKIFRVKLNIRRVVGQPSSKTDFVVLGDNAGPSKIAAIKKHGIRTVNEDEFLALIGSRKGGKVDEKTKKKMEKEEAAIKEAAKELEKREENEKRTYAGGYVHHFMVTQPLLNHPI